MQWKRSCCRNSGFNVFGVCDLCDLNAALTGVLLTMFPMPLKRKHHGLKMFTVKLRRVFTAHDSPVRVSRGRNEFSPLFLVLLSGGKYYMNRMKAALIHTIIFSPSEAVLRILPNLSKAAFSGRN